MKISNAHEIVKLYFLIIILNTLFLYIFFKILYCFIWILFLFIKYKTLIFLNFLKFFIFLFNNIINKNQNECASQKDQYNSDWKNAQKEAEFKARDYADYYDLKEREVFYKKNKYKSNPDFANFVGGNVYGFSTALFIPFFNSKGFSNSSRNWFFFQQMKKTSSQPLITGFAFVLSARAIKWTSTQDFNEELHEIKKEVKYYFLKHDTTINFLSQGLINQQLQHDEMKQTINFQNQTINFQNQTINGMDQKIKNLELITNMLLQNHHNSYAQCYYLGTEPYLNSKRLYQNSYNKNPSPNTKYFPKSNFFM